MALANRQDEIRKANGELLGIFYFDVVLEQKQDAEETSSMMTDWKWRGGWRIEDAQQTSNPEKMEIFHSAGDGGGIPTRFLRRFPITYIIETATMKVVAGEKGDEYDPAQGGEPIDVLAEIQKINNQSN